MVCESQNLLINDKNVGDLYLHLDDGARTTVLSTVGSSFLLQHEMHVGWRPGISFHGTGHAVERAPAATEIICPTPVNRSLRSLSDNSLNFYRQTASKHKYPPHHHIGTSFDQT
jgi:hypothetical protein